MDNLSDLWEKNLKPHIRRIWDVAARLGEGPVYDRRDDTLLFVDIKGRRLYRLHLGSDDLEHWETPDLMCWVVPRSSPQGYIAGMGLSIGTLSLDPFRFEPFHEVGAARPTYRLNDAKADADGWLWFGTMDNAEKDHNGCLYSVSPDRKVTVADIGYAVTNGPSFSPDGAFLYHTDTARRVVFRFKRTSGGLLTDKRALIRFPESWGYPDGMTTDAEGAIWIAHWAGGRISRFFPEGELHSTFEMPVAGITSCCFAGKNLDRMFVTSAVGEGAGQPNAGALFEVECGALGATPHPFGG